MNFEEQQYLTLVLSNQRLRSRFIRDLEIESILGESTEEHFQSYKERKGLDGVNTVQSQKLAASPT